MWGGGSVCEGRVWLESVVHGWGVQGGDHLRGDLARGNTQLGGAESSSGERRGSELGVGVGSKCLVWGEGGREGGGEAHLLWEEGGGVGGSGSNALSWVGGGGGVGRASVEGLVIGPL